MASALYLGEPGYPILARALAAAADGDGAPLLTLSDRYTGRNDDGSYRNEQEAFWALSCIDSGFPIADDAQLRALEERAVVAAPHFGASSVNLGAVCRDWPVPPVAQSGALLARGAPPILVVGTTGDPATPVAWAESLADDLTSGVLVLVEGSQHGTYAFGANECLDDIGTRYLVDLEVPSQGTMCG
ncbi:MAG: alpha/beta hydrolase [Acidimicrobiia bacterium]